MAINELDTARLICNDQLNKINGMIDQFGKLDDRFIDTIQSIEDDIRNLTPSDPNILLQACTSLLDLFTPPSINTNNIKEMLEKCLNIKNEFKNPDNLLKDTIKKYLDAGYNKLKDLLNIDISPPEFGISSKLNDIKKEIDKYTSGYLNSIDQMLDCILSVCNSFNDIIDLDNKIESINNITDRLHINDVTGNFDYTKMLNKYSNEIPQTTIDNIKTTINTIDIANNRLSNTANNILTVKLYTCVKDPIIVIPENELYMVYLDPNLTEYNNWVSIFKSSYPLDQDVSKSGNLDSNIQLTNFSIKENITPNGHFYSEYKFDITIIIGNYNITRTYIDRYGIPIHNMKWKLYNDDISICIEEDKIVLLENFNKSIINCIKHTLKLININEITEQLN